MLRRRRSRSLLAGLLAAGALVVPGGPATVDAAPTRLPQLERELLAAAGGGLTVARAADGSQVRLLGGGRPLSPPDDAPPADVARSFIDQYGALFTGTTADELTADGSLTTADGGAAVRFQQTVDGVPVLAGQLVVRVDGDGRVRSTAGEALTDGAEVLPTLRTTPAVPATDATDVARRLTARNDERDLADLQTTEPELWIYDPALVGADDPAGARLVWLVQVRTSSGEVDRVVLVDAATGTIALTWSDVRQIDSQVCDNGGIERSSVAEADCPSGTQTVVRSDALSTPSGVADVENAYVLSKAVLAFYASLGRNSIDDAGMVLHSTVRMCFVDDCPFVNAFWDGTQMVYGAGFASADDVVAHELTHGVTQYESGLLSYSESGAIDESLSDVFGELFDQSYDGAADDDSPAARWLVGEDLPIGALRDMQDPTSLGDPDRMTSPFYSGSSNDRYGIHSNSGVNNKAASLIADGGSFNGVSVAGIGNAKTAFVYYELQTSVLTPGSDYLDLFRALPQACTNLVGQHGIVPADCASVTAAVTATEMNLAPTTTGARLVAAECPSGQVRTSTVYTNSMEASSGWSFAATNSAAAWEFTTDASQSGTTSMYGPDPDIKATGTATMSSTVVVPNTDTYLRFDHTFSFDTSGTFPSFRYWDGGFVRYSTNGGPFRDLAALTDVGAVNGYNGVLRSAGQSNDNASAGRAAFVSNSPGYQRSRFDLGALAGTAVAIQFAVDTDSLAGDSGWSIDDVEIYTCGAPGSTVPTTVPTAPAPSGFVASSPSRVFDTRPGESPNALRTVAATPVLPSGPLDVSMVGLPGGVTPGTGVAAVSLNVTVTSPRTDGFVTVYPCGTRTLVASVNFRAGQTVANAVIAPVSIAGHVCFFTSTPTDLVVDINGWFGGSDAFRPAGPERIFDTRPGESPNALLSVPGTAVVPTAPLDVVVAGLGGGSITPASGLSAVSLNVTVTNPRADGFVTVYPCRDRRLVASVNFTVGQTISNAVIAPVSADGHLCFFTSSPTDLVVDINGWFPVGAGHRAVGPERVFDTRPGESPGALRSVPAVRLTPGVPVRVQMTGLPGDLTPSSGVGAVALNVTVTNTAAAGFITVYPCAARPFVSSVNFTAGQTLSNAVIAPLAPDGTVCFESSAATDLVVDVLGWFPT